MRRVTGDRPPNYSARMRRKGLRPISRGCQSFRANRKSRPTFKFVASVCAGTRGAVVFPWSKGFDYDPDSVQYAPDFALHAASFGLQEFLQLLEFRDQLFEFVNGIGSQL